jgi:hypothetical protein
MARSKGSGRGTKQERKAQRRAAAAVGRGPNRPARTDRTFPGTPARLVGPRKPSQLRGGGGRRP